MLFAEGSGIPQRGGGGQPPSLRLFNFIVEAMKSLPASKSIPAWQAERAKKLQRACQTIKAAIQRGEKISRAIRRAARSRSGRTYKSDPSRRMALSTATMRRMWDIWKRGGEIPAAFKLNYHVQPSAVPAAVLERFVISCSGLPQPSLAAAWRQFSARGRGLWTGRRPARRLKISDDQIYHYFPAAKFYLMQAQLRAVENALVELARLRFEAIAEIRRRLPTPPPRPRLKPATTFEI